MTSIKSGFLKERTLQIFEKGIDTFEMTCDRVSTAGSISQRACTFCGSRVVLYPIVDALHLVHGAIGCAAYTWDIRGSMSSGPQLHRSSFCTDLREKEVIYGGEKKLKNALYILIEEHQPKAAFVYSTCIAGIIGDDVGAVCKEVQKKTGIAVIPVHSEGFKGTKKDGYRAACDALMRIIGMNDTPQVPLSVNILGDFNIAGEIWVIKKYFEQMGLKIVATLTGDARVEQIKSAHTAQLNIVQCSGSMRFLAKQMKEKYGIPFINASFSGINDTAKALYDAADFFCNKSVMENTRNLISNEIALITPFINSYRNKCKGKKAALYVGGAFKAMSLIKALRILGIQTILAGTQTGSKEDYEALKTLCDDGTVLLDDSNPIEMSKFIIEKKADLFIGGVKERPLAYKLGIAFCDHNHERKTGLAGFEGMVNFAREVSLSVNSPVWKFAPRRGREYYV
ncbi:MAG: nitrogenase iron-molybdenum cofactor biosynthesis protein NifE [Chitinispirillaceae bacterium]|nr:nitrogenase iron-molybdenum cofactor biosynthesis protein NifE [Chitinispirillaceae bacterium]